MGVLTVDEGGEPQAFRISEGALSVGSGEEMDLQLKAEDVALYHAELTCQDEALFVEPQPGVVPPTIHGVALKQKTRLGPGQELRIGRAKLTWRAEGVPAAPAARSTAGRSPSARRSGSKRRTRSTPSSGGVPGWMIVVGILAAVGVAFFFLQDGLTGTNEVADTANAKFHLRKAEELIASRNADAAQENLDKIVRSTLSPSEATRLAEVEEGIQRELAEIVRLAEEERGNKWFRRRVEDFEERYLTGDPEPPKVRYFLELCEDFRSRWPEHSRLAWVDRQERRFGNSVKLGTPLDYEDVRWRADFLTSGRPRDYRTALALLEEFRERAENSEERVGTADLIARLQSERAVFHREQVKEAHEEFDRGRKSYAIDRLVQLIMKLGETSLEDEAAEILVKFPDIEPTLRGYRDERPDDFELLSKNRVMAKFLAERGISSN